MVKNRLGWIAGATLICGLSAAAWSQIVQDDDVPSTADTLNLPSDLTIFGKSDPSVHKATAIVNGAIITDTDIDHRFALVLVANGNQIDESERERLRLQVFRNLIDETLQIQEAKANDIVISPEEIDQTFARVSGNFRRNPKDFATYLSQVGSSAASMKRQIEGELAWRRLLGRRVEPFVSVSDEEVNAIMSRLNASKGATEYRIGEIFLSGTPATIAETENNAARIVDQLRKGGSFAAYARQFSEASTAAVGGDLGWVRGEQLPEPLAAAASQMTPGQVSPPIPVAGGYSIIALVDQRQILTSDPRDAVLALKQVSIKFPAGETESRAAPKVEAFSKEMSSVSGCGTVAAVASRIGAEVIDSDQVRVRDLPAPLQQIMLDLQIGQASRPFGSLQDGVRSLVLCGRDDAQSADGPSFDQIYAQLEEDRVNRRARRYLRDLRRDAVVEYR
ncbi:MAG: peptidylprolyl isomerase [Sphingomonadaceae bacterium]